MAKKKKQKPEKKIIETLKCEFTKKEVEEHSKRLADHLKNIESIKDEKKATIASYNSRIEEHSKEINRLANIVKDEYEFRPVDCIVKYHEPKENIKTIVRLDTGKTVREEAMTLDERQGNLFEQA